ncbi:MAG: DEAD/DEAH box helicase [Gammaproteobacteria bacterium]|nr:DEAD/DEAH box helicase [Gammaproteobacteria bacterium]
MTDTNDVPSFAELGLPTHILNALSKLGYETPSPIQAAAIPELLEGRDILGMAQTGTGKTAAFALPILGDFDPAMRSKSPTALVLAPTRELAQQVAEAFTSYGARDLKCNVVSVYGGSPYGPQSSALRRGADIVVGTPGRVMDHMRRGNLDLSELNTLVLDEADEMLRMGFIEDVEWVLEQAPEDRRIALFSATMPREVARIAKQYLNDPAEVKIEAKETTNDSIRQRFVLVHGGQKAELIARVLEAEETDGVMVFVRTKMATVEVADFLRSQGHSAEALNGDLSQDQRDKTVTRLKNGKVNVVVATDVAARGLDVERISHVINYDIPHDPESYVHRIGRTGRAGREGDAILFVQPREQRMLRLIEKVTRSKVEEMEAPSVDEINAMRKTRLVATVEKRLERDLTQYRDLVAGLQEQTGLPLEDIAAALAVELGRGRPFLLDERHKFRNISRDGKGNSGNERSGRFERDSRRPERRERPQRDPQRDAERDKKKREHVMGGLEDGMERFRVEVGHAHGVKPGNLVGAIANEAGLDSQNIGRIELFDSFSVVDLPEGMPKDLFKHLKGVWVCGQKLGLSRFEGNLEENAVKPRGGKPGGPRRDGRSGGFGGGPRRDGGRDSRRDGGREERRDRRPPHGGHREAERRFNDDERSPRPPRDRQFDGDREGGSRPAFKGKRHGGDDKAKKPRKKVRAAAMKNKGKPKRKPK